MGTRGGHNRTSPAIEAEICRLYRDGRSMRAIARDFGMEFHTTVARILNRNGIVRRPHDQPRRHAAEPGVCAAYRKGQSISSISRQMGVHRNTISDILGRNGLRIRTKKEPPNAGSQGEKHHCCGSLKRKPCFCSQPLQVREIMVARAA